jgi:AmiR/NasT family two-component response regulator
VLNDASAMADEIPQLQRALETRDIVGQAKGVLMERFDIDRRRGFQTAGFLRPPTPRWPSWPTS